MIAEAVLAETRASRSTASVSRSGKAIKTAGEHTVVISTSIATFMLTFTLMVGVDEAAVEEEVEEAVDRG